MAREPEGDEPTSYIRLQMLAPIDASSGLSTANAGPERAAPAAHWVADAGLRGAPGPLPHFDRIQRSFGRHDLANVQASIGGEAREANEQLGSLASTAGAQIAV